MASRISQMRNAQPQPQQSLSDSIEQTKMLMHRLEGLPNREAVINNLLQSNPQLGAITALLRNGNGLEEIAKQMARYNNIDINKLINSLQTNI